MFEKTQMWNAPKPLDYFHWDGESYDLLAVLVERKGLGWEVVDTSEPINPGAVEVRDAGGNVLASLIPRATFQLDAQGAFEPAQNFDNLKPYPAEWL